jgi:hypothetical protein
MGICICVVRLAILSNVLREVQVTSLSNNHKLAELVNFPSLRRKHLKLHDLLDIHRPPTNESLRSKPSKCIFGDSLSRLSVASLT